MKLLWGILLAVGTPAYAVTTCEISGHGPPRESRVLFRGEVSDGEAIFISRAEHVVRFDITAKHHVGELMALHRRTYVAVTEAPDGFVTLAVGLYRYWSPQLRVAREPFRDDAVAIGPASEVTGLVVPSRNTSVRCGPKDKVGRS